MDLYRYTWTVHGHAKQILNLVRTATLFLHHASSYELGRYYCNYKKPSHAHTKKVHRSKHWPSYQRSDDSCNRSTLFTFCYSSGRPAHVLLHLKHFPLLRRRLQKALTLLHQPVALGTVNPTIRVFHRVVFSHGVHRHRREKENIDPVRSSRDPRDIGDARSLNG